jgi:phage replication O-like protein O
LIQEQERFVRFPTCILEALLDMSLNGTQWRICLWVIRQTYGWNRNSTPFTWYGVAKAIHITRPALYRAGQALLAAQILTVRDGHLAIQTDCGLWRRTERPGSAALPSSNVAGKQPLALPDSNESVAGRQPKRCQEATLFRRAKDSSKDNIKKKEKIAVSAGSARPTFQNGAFSEQHHPAGAARPIPGKYDGLSQNR